VGRPKKDIDTRVVAGMASVGATNVEIADFVGCDEGTIRVRFSDVLTKARAGLRTRLRRKQLDVALKGNATMLIWLGKQMLQQCDKPAFDLSPHELKQLSGEELDQLVAGQIPLRLRLRDAERAGLNAC
jgi:precorrin-4 methylase